MTNIPPELRALADAALRFAEVDKSAKDRMRFSVEEFAALGEFHEAAEAYRATQALKECRPEGNKAGTYWLRRNDGMMCVGSYEPLSDYVWSVLGHGEFDAVHAQAHGWTVHGECRFGETDVVATDEAIAEFFAEIGRHPNWCRPDQIREIVAHFRAPKLEISDEEIDEAAGLNCDAWPTSIGGWRTAIRAVIAKVGGEK